MYTEVDMAVQRTKFGDRISVALPSLRIYFGSGTTGGALHHPHHRAADLDFPSDPLAFSPRRGPAEPDIGAKATPVPARADLGLVIAQASEVIQAHDRGLLVAEYMARNVMEGRTAACFVTHIVRQEGSDALPARRGHRIRLDAAAVGCADAQCLGARIEHAEQQGGLRVLHLAEEVPLRQPCRVGRIKARVSLRQREGSVPGDRSSGLDLSLLQGFGGKAFDR